MSYNEFEIAPEGGEPVELYEITVGVESPSYKITSSGYAETIGGFVYLPEALKRDKAEDGPTKRNQEFTFEMPASHPFPMRYAGAIPGARVQLIVSRFHRPDGATPEVQEVFVGYVESVSVTDNMHRAKITARSELAAMSHTIPREGYQTQCNNLLYGVRCGADKTDPAFRRLNTPVDSIDGRTYTIGGAAKFPDGWFAAGRISIDNDTDHRMILSHTTDQIEISVPFPAEPSIATIYAGCAHAFTVCVDKFDRGIAFRGFHAVPNRNPYSDGVL